MSITLLIIPMLALLTGLCLMRRACHRQEHAACRACGYDLTGSSDSAHCPECGRVLTQAAVEPPGEIAVRWRSFWIGFILVLASSFVLAPVLLLAVLRLL
jgi:hypothetical protein